MGKYSNEIKKIFENMSDTLSVILEEEKAIIAGGIISRIFSGRSTKDSDVDVYFRSAESLARTLYAIGGTENIVTDWTDKSIMIKSGKNGCIVQFIIIDYFENAFQIFDKFDFTCVMGAYDLGIEDEVSSCFVFHEDFMMHNAQRKLVYNPKTEFPVISALRVHKYEKEGYKISKNEFVKVLLSIMNLEIKSWEDAEKQFGKFYGTSLSGMITDELKEKEFSKELLLEIVENYSFTHDVKPPSGKTIYNWQEFVVQITGIKEKAYLWKNSYFTVSGDTWKRISDSEREFYHLVDKHNHFDFGGRVYKYVVSKPDGKFVSQYRTSFEYQIGVPAIDETNGLWFYYLPGIKVAKQVYGTNPDRVLVEFNLIRLKNEAYSPEVDGQAYELLPTKIFSKEEENELLEKSRSFTHFSENLPF